MLTDEHRKAATGAGLVLAIGAAAFLALGWLFSTLHCWHIHGGRIIPCAVEVLWKGTDV